MSIRLPSLHSLLPLSLRHLLAAAMLALMGAVVVSILWITQQVAGKSLEQAAIESITSRTAAARDRIDEEIYERLRDVMSAAESLQSNPSREHTHTLLESMAHRYPDYSWMATVNRNGIVQMATKGMLEGQSVAQRAWFPEGLKGSFVGDVHEAVLLGKLMGDATDTARQQPWRFVDFSVPLIGPSGKIIGVFGAHLNWEWAHGIFKGFESHAESGYQRDVLILDKNNIVLYGPEALQGTYFEAPPPLKNQRPSWKMNEQWLLAAAPSLGHLDFKGLGWTIVIREPMDNVLYPIHQMRQVVLIWSLLMMGVFLIVALFIGRWIAHPLEILSNAAKNDDFTPIIEDNIISNNTNNKINNNYHNYYEIIQLHKAFGGMLKRLSDSKEEIHREVLQRTAEVKHLSDALDTHAIVSISDVSGKITYVNDKFCDISGYSPEELIGKTHSIVKSEFHSKEFYKTLWQKITSGQSWQGKVCNRRKNGSIYWVQSTITPTKFNPDSPHCYISIRTDITDVILEQEARRAAEMAADKANRAKSVFLSSMSHELRTPLNSILGFAQILESSKKRPLDEKQKSNVQQIIRGGEHLLMLINEILDLALIESGKLLLSIEPIDPIILIEDCISLIQGQAQNKNITLSFPHSTPIEIKSIFIYADAMRFKQVMLNLISNSIKYNHSEGTVTVLISSENNSENKRIRITVQDNGLGIPLEKQSEIFKPFNRLGSENSEIEGTGIGLTITQNLTKSMGGSIGFTSQYGEGSSFWVEFPQATVVANLVVKY